MFQGFSRVFEKCLFVRWSNDGYDSANPYNDIAPFKHVINEMYARDTSKKIRSAIKTKMREGSYIGNFAPYGFKKSPGDKNRLVIDCETAPIVSVIFRMAAEGSRPSEIADYLNRSGIASPAMYRCSIHPHLNPGDYTSRREWTSSSVSKILANIVYLGHTAQGKTSKPSFKSKTAFRKPRGEWFVVENTHEPIVTQDVFDIVRKRSVSRRLPPKTGFVNVFSGVAKCADCGGNMSTTGSRGIGGNGNPSYRLVCGRYKLHGSGDCTNHFICYDLLYNSVLSEARRLLTLSENEKKEVAAGLEKAKSDETRVTAGKGPAKHLAMLECRDKELDNLIMKIYEDNVNGKISDERFAKLNAAYEAEQMEVAQKIKMLKVSAGQGGEGEGDRKDSYRDFYEEAESLAYMGELTPNLVKRLIDRIEVGQGCYEKTPKGRVKHQYVKVFWLFDGAES